MNLVEENKLIVEIPFINRINPVDYITLTEQLIKDPKLFAETDLLKKMWLDGQRFDEEHLKKITNYSKLLQRWTSNFEIENLSDLFIDFGIYRYFYKEVGASLKFNPLSQSTAGLHVLDQILVLLKRYVELIHPKIVYTMIDVIVDDNGLAIRDSEIRFDCKKLKMFTNHSSVTNEKEISSNELLQQNVIVYVVSIGEAIDNTIKLLTIRGEMFDAYLLNGIGAGAAEMVANDLNAYMNDNYGVEGYVYKRLSPGYGDWSVTEQSKIFKILNPEINVGVVLNDSHIMLPEKSTSGIMGLTKINQV